jgi:glutamate synthase domain-containing protein 3
MVQVAPTRPATDEALVIDGANLDTRHINAAIRNGIAAGHKRIRLLNPGSKHSLAPAIFEDVDLTIEGSVGYFGVTIGDGIRAHITGRAGWSLAEGMMSGEIVVEKNAGSSTAASLRGGTVVVKGSVGGRTGIQQKGGTIVVGGDSGFLTGFMMQRGRMIICGNVGRAAGDSMYEGEIFVGGQIASLGVDTLLVQPTELELAEVRAELQRYGLPADRDWKKIAAGKALYNYDSLEPNERKMML